MSISLWPETDTTLFVKENFLAYQKKLLTKLKVLADLFDMFAKTYKVTMPPLKKRFPGEFSSA